MTAGFQPLFDSSNPAGWPILPSVLLESAPSGWLLTDRDGVIHYVNAQIERLFGYERSELLGQTVEILVPERLREIHLQHRARYAQNPTMRPMGLGMSLAARRKDGSEFAVEISLSPVETSLGMFIIAVMRDVTERQQLEEERNHFQMELEMERERDRIGMDLHDGIMQEIYASGLTLELALGDLEDDPDAAGEGIERAIDQLHDVIRNIRAYIFDLRPREYSGNLAASLAELAREFRQNTLIETLDNVPTALPEIGQEAAVAVYHIVHEAFSNVRKHSQASEVMLNAYIEESTLCVEVVDNGRGFNVDASRPQVNRGLRNMIARAKLAGALLNIASKPSSGTAVKLTVPLTPTPEA